MSKSVDNAKNRGRLKRITLGMAFSSQISPFRAKMAIQSLILRAKGEPGNLVRQENGQSSFVEIRQN